MQLDVDGRLQERAARYMVERELWAWWQAEETWMRAPRRTHPSRRPGPGQLALVPDFGTNAYGAHPRDANGRADYRTARALLTGAATALTARKAPEPIDDILGRMLGAERIA